jgi:hypothetical protein
MADLRSDQSNTLPIAGTKDRLASLAKQHPIDFDSYATNVVMPCCGFSFDYGHEDCVDGEPNRVYDPPRWTCPCCRRTYEFLGLGLHELASDEIGAGDAE